MQPSKALTETKPTNNIDSMVYLSVKGEKNYNREETNSGALD